MSANKSPKHIVSVATGSTPPPNPWYYSDWTAVVRRNYFANLDRLGQWNPATQSLQPVTAGSLGTDADQTIYIVTHGWAPGYRSVVDTSGADLLWWDSNATVNGVPASAWAWSPVTAPPQYPCSPPFPVNPTGMLQSILANDPQAIVLAWSWVDDSATDSTTDLWDLTEVYQSEAHTHANGLRLAYALQEAIIASNWNSVRIRLIGHSHGSKVATVAAATLQQRGAMVSKLTILDSPETESSLSNYGANLLGCYLQQMSVANPLTLQGGAYVDNYVSYFGAGYISSVSGSPLNNVVEFALAPSLLYYGESEAAYIGDCHTYAAGWYGGAAAGASVSQNPLGLANPPAPNDYAPSLTLNQVLTSPVTEAQQWTLTAGETTWVDYTYTMFPLEITADSSGMTGTVDIIPDPTNPDLVSQVILGPADGYSSFLSTFVADNTDQYGMTFTLQWDNPQVGDYFVVNIGGTDETLYTALVIDGQSLQQNGAPIQTTTTVAINCDTDLVESAYLSIYFYSGVSGSGSQVTLSDFQYVVVSNATGIGRIRRETRAVVLSA